MDIIEQAAKRLAELRNAGVAAPAAEPVQTQAAPAPAVPVMAPAQSQRVDIDLNHLAAQSIVTPTVGRSHLADEFRILKRPLLSNATGKGATMVSNGNLIMITSAVPGEGKSFTAANLAMSIATELDHTVLLVDADVARPSIPRIFGIPPSKGLLDVLVDGIDLSQVLLRTSVEKLSILQSGTQHPRATELLASEAMNQLLLDMASRYSDRIIIFDSPPLLVTTEARVLATHMGQVVMVVRAEHTPNADVRHAFSFLEACPVKMAVLNQAPAGAAGGYGYGYGYGYGAKPYE